MLARHEQVRESRLVFALQALLNLSHQLVSIAADACKDFARLIAFAGKTRKRGDSGISKEPRRTRPKATPPSNTSSARPQPQPKLASAPPAIWRECHCSERR